MFRRTTACHGKTGRLEHVVIQGSRTELLDLYVDDAGHGFARMRPSIRILTGGICWPTVVTTLLTMVGGDRYRWQMSIMDISHRVLRCHTFSGVSLSPMTLMTPQRKS